MRIEPYIHRWQGSPFGAETAPPWSLTQRAPELVRGAISGLGPGYEVWGDVAVHRSAEVEPGALLKGPVIVGPRSFVSSFALLCGGVFLDEDCIIGPAVELKTVFMFSGSKAAHLNFIGDSIVGSEVNIEAGAMVANYRNEFADKEIRLMVSGVLIETGVDKFGALIGDGTKIGANAVLAPGAVLPVGARVPRLGLVDQRETTAERDWQRDKARLLRDKG